MKPIIYKEVSDETNNQFYLELWQGDQHIKISLEATMGFKGGYKWDEVREHIDNLAKRRKQTVLEQAGIEENQ